MGGAEVDRMVLDLMDACASARVPLPLHREPAELRSLIEKVIRRVVFERDHRRVRIDAARTHTLLIDSYRIERVVASLIRNALKHAKDHSVHVRISDEQEWIRIAVSAGPGIPPFELDRFSRAIIDAHGGRIGHLYFELPTR